MCRVWEFKTKDVGFSHPTHEKSNFLFDVSCVSFFLWMCHVWIHTSVVLGYATLDGASCGCVGCEKILCVMREYICGTMQ